jgi:hypothetical protein
MDENEKQVGPVAIEEQEADIEVRIRASLQEEYNTRLESEIQKISGEMQKENKKIVEEAITRFRKEMEPPSEEDIQKLLNQEYMEFEIDIKPRNGEKKHFVIRELSSETEKKIYKEVKRILVPFSSDLAALSMNLLEGDAAKKIVQLMNTFEPMLDVAVNVCAICLNPFGEDEEVDEEWVRKNLSNTRIIKILSAQMEANKMRDFFSLLFHNTKLLTR